MHHTHDDARLFVSLILGYLLLLLAGCQWETGALLRVFSEGRMLHQIAVMCVCVCVCVCVNTKCALLLFDGCIRWMSIYSD